MLLEHLGLDAEGRAVRDAVNAALAAGIVTRGSGGSRSAALYDLGGVGDYVAAHV